MNCRVLLTLLLLLCSHGAWSQLPASDNSPRDHAVLSRLPGSEIVDYRVLDRTNYRLALGRMQRVNGRVTAGSEERLQGRLVRITYQIPSGYPGSDVFERLSGQLLDGAAGELFRCQGRGCGSSNFWANDVFGNPILYGPETDQFYLAVSLGSGEAVSGYAALYVVTRGNRRVYAHLDVLELPRDELDAPAATAESLLLRLQQEGSAMVRGLTFSDDDRLSDDNGLALLLETLSRDPMLRVYVVAHLRGEGSLQSLLQRSAARADLVVTRLVGEGIDAGRLNAQGVGPLAPVCAQAPCSERIEVVVQQ